MGSEGKVAVWGGIPGQGGVVGEMRQGGEQRGPVQAREEVDVHRHVTAQETGVSSPGVWTVIRVTAMEEMEARS